MNEKIKIKVEKIKKKSDVNDKYFVVRVNLESGILCFNAEANYFFFDLETKNKSPCTIDTAADRSSVLSLFKTSSFL